MKARVAAVVALLALTMASVGCRPREYVHRVMVPSGRPGYAIKCGEQAACFYMASRACRHGYDIVTNGGGDSSSSASATNIGGTVFASGRTDQGGFMVIECRQGARTPESTECGHDERRWQRCEELGGQCRAGMDGVYRCKR